MGNGSSLRPVFEGLIIMRKIEQSAQVYETIADVQGSADTRRIPIDKVGIKDIRHLVRVKDRFDGQQHTVASFNMYVDLPHNFKGTHMSRFVEILNRRDKEISISSFSAFRCSGGGRRRLWLEYATGRLS